MKALLPVLFFGFIGCGGAVAQTVIVTGGGNVQINRTPFFPPRKITINMTLQLTAPSPVLSNPGNVTQTAIETNRALYDVVDHECEVLTKTFAGECRLVQLSGNNSVGVRNQQQSNTNATATFEIDQPASVPDPAPTPGPARN